MQQTVQETQNNVSKFKKVYTGIIEECIARRKSSGSTQKDVASMLNVDVRKIIELEKGNGGVGLSLRYADIYDIEVTLSMKAW